MPPVGVWGKGIGSGEAARVATSTPPIAASCLTVFQRGRGKVTNYGKMTPISQLANAVTWCNRTCLWRGSVLSLPEVMFAINYFFLFPSLMMFLLFYVTSLHHEAVRLFWGEIHLPKPRFAFQTSCFSWCIAWKCSAAREEKKRRGIFAPSTTCDCQLSSRTSSGRLLIWFLFSGSNLCDPPPLVSRPTAGETGERLPKLLFCS